MKAFKAKMAIGLSVLLAAATVTGAAACSKPGGNPGNNGGNPGNNGGTPSEVITQVDPDVSGTLKLAYKAQNREKEVAQSLANGFMSVFKNVTVEVVPYSDETSKAITKFYQANDMPDIFMSDSFSMLTLSATEDLLLNFTPYIEKETEEGTFSVDDYYEAYLRLGQLNFGGVQYLVPRSADRVVCHVNKRLVKLAEEKTGKEIQSKIRNGWTWTDFYEVCAVLKEANVARYLLDDMMKWEAVWNPVFKSYGVEYFNDAGDIVIDSQATQNALNHFKKWVDDGICASPTSGQSADFEYGRGVFYFNSMAASQELKTLMEAYEDTENEFTMEQAIDNYDVVTFPVDPNNPLIGAGTAGYCGYGGSEHPELVWQFMKYMLTKDGQNAIADSGVNYVPVRKDMADYTDSENNHWGKGYEQFNLSAYTYKSGELKEDGTQEEDWNCYTDYFKVKGSRYAVSLNSGVSTFVTTYASGKSYSTVVNNLQKTWKATLSKK